ncbi:MAG TPA: Hsp70 family protein [Terriglobia bacterium]|jgi:molecular chaperone DnaK (HSP70)
MNSVIGIDLGTTNCAVARREIAAASTGAGVTIPQLTSPGTLEERALLPSFLYLPQADEFAEGTLALPWQPDSEVIAGEFARAHGMKVPTRLVVSAKSWLSHSGVDRSAKILPWGAPADVDKVSPVDASARYLRHIAGALRHANIDYSEVILTVPASFDAAARELTIEAARAAQLENVTLLEEPQAALYAWLEKSGDSFRKQVELGDVILVVDVGGGTTDLSLIRVTEEGGDLQLTRMAVGDHILLGGDNMDLTLAHNLARDRKLDAWQFTSLTYGCRQAKELLFADPKLAKAPISVVSRGSALVGGTLKFELTRQDLARILVDGFMPQVPVSETPQSARRTGLTQVALPYAQDPAITRHLAAFLTRQSRIAEGRSFVHPTAILFNGGVFKADVLKARVIEVVNQWLAADGGSAVKELESAGLDLAVARGAAYYGWVRHGHGIRIRGGTARAYYVGVEAAMPAVPGFEPPVRAVCVAPFGMEEGTQADIPPQEFALVVGEPTVFRFFASSVRRDDRVGDTVEDAARSDELEEVAPIETSLKGESGRLVPVNLQAAVTEVGTLELRCLEKGGSGHWNLELNVRTGERDVA